jgi:hypothetical protein
MTCLPVASVSVLLWSCLSATGWCQPASPQRPLFETVIGARLSARQQEIIDAETTAKSHRLVSVDFGALADGNLVINALEDASQAAAPTDRFFDKEDGWVTWRFAYPSPDDYALLTVDERPEQEPPRMTGVVRVAGDVFTIKPLGDPLSRADLHVVFLHDTSRFPNDAPPLTEGLEARKQEMAALETRQMRQVSAPVYTVLVVYTPAAARSVFRDTDMGGLIRTAESQTNYTYYASRVTLLADVVYETMIEYAESKNSNTDLDRLTNGSSGLDQVHRLREQYRADVVIMLCVLNDGFCGRAWLGANRGTAFAVVDPSCVLNNYSFPHEIGHLFGAMHEREQSGGVARFPYGFAHCYLDSRTSSRKRTIMATPSCGGERMHYWSSPEIGTGVANQSDNARVLREQAFYIMSFY